MPPFKRIAYVANSRVPSRQANTVHVLNMAAGFAAVGQDTTLIARGDDLPPDRIFADFGLPARFRMRLLRGRHSWLVDRISFILHVRNVLRKERPGFVYGRSCYGLLAGVPGGMPFAYDLHVFATQRQRRLESALFHRPNFLFATAISKALADRYVATYPLLRDRMLIAPCAASSSVRPPSGPRDDGPIRIYYVGQLYAGRGIDLALQLAELEPALEFHVVGGEEADVRHWASRAPANVIFHGYVTPAGLPAHYARADICIAPYGSSVAVHGGGDTAAGMSPMKIFEYMSYARAIVASDLAVLREVVSPGQEGLLCEPGNIAQWRAAIRRLAEDEELRRRLGSVARRRFERDFTWETRARRILDFAAVQLEIERGSSSG